MANFISEDQIEQSLLQKLQQNYGYELLNAYTANPEQLNDGSERSDKRHVILAKRLQNACETLNPQIPRNIIQQEIDKLLARTTQQTTTLFKHNQSLYQQIREGIPVEFDNPQGKKQHETLTLINLKQPRHNQFLAVSQLWIKSTAAAPKAQYRRPDVILYVNGLPLVFIELKNSNIALKNAFDINLQEYIHDIPQLFQANAFCLLSNGINTRVGAFNAGWEYFFQWLRPTDEKQVVDREAIEAQGISIQYAIEGLAEPQRLLDYVENFILFEQDKIKIIAQNHQFLGVNNAYQRFLEREQNNHQLGVFWHTQGSGKSYSMVFYVRKILRKVTGNFSFVIVTDRQDLNKQIYRNFLKAGVLHDKDKAMPQSAEQLREYIGQNKKLIFTLIQKFHYPKGKHYPRLFDPEKEGREIIVMIDEAHRSQYEDLAENMKAGLQGAHFMAFTGTPLLQRDRATQQRKTNKWFGSYVSEYNFQQAMEDRATVPLFYEKRVPKVLILKDELNEEFCQLLEDEELTDAQREKLERKYSTELEVIKRDDRLTTIAKDIVYHFPRRGYLGKAMVISVDKFTAVKMHEKVQQEWQEEMKRLRKTLAHSPNDVEKQNTKRLIKFMEGVEMAVVISDPSADEDKFQKLGLSLKPHIERLNRIDAAGHDIEHNFKDPEHPLQLVFVCAMWLTGFDAPTVSTLYLDKPMKGHTLMQTIARANRVTDYRISALNGELVEKCNGEIIDYYNVFRNMKKALKAYGQGDSDDDSSATVQNKDQLFVLLNEAVVQTVTFCADIGIDFTKVFQTGDTFKQLEHFTAFADHLLSNETWRKSFNVYENTVSSLYAACKPEIHERGYREDIAAIRYLRGVLEGKIVEIDLSVIDPKVSTLLDQSILVDEDESLKAREFQAEYQFIQRGKTWDLSKIDFDSLREEFKETPYKHIEISDMRAFLEKKLQQMLAENSQRADFATRLQSIIERYNSGASSTENYFEELVVFIQALQEEEQRHLREGLSQDELELYDLLRKEKMTQAEEQAVKSAAKHLLQRLVDEQPKVLVNRWWEDTQTQLTVKSTIENVLDNDLPPSYDRLLFKEKCDNVYQLTLTLAANGQKWAAAG
ncbi:type I restriction endonuclease subunit R [Candidatus Thiothrix anitrata]|uniref:Type I restriction enzyme endonuclease subunit n=1 Tax=Candidatus Thiothrix anitrata TaxID=2823902 RepID=A0ABX7X8A8_9GAMM|nr:type I restriction endonuclease subunit R [Candidatus Thiothrix anitrata]QTR50955.1 type I restriction endonuclease subunit R [Candidatus Thiothrix anitrata]